MARRLRIEYEGACYHVMNRGNGRDGSVCCTATTTTSSPSSSTTALRTSTAPPGPTQSPHPGSRAVPTCRRHPPGRPRSPAPVRRPMDRAVLLTPHRGGI